MRLIITKILLLSACLLVGCAPDPGKPVNDNHGYGFDYDFETLEGVRVRNNSATYIQPEIIDTYYRMVASCTGIDGADMLIIFQDTDIIDIYGNATGKAGYAYFDGLIIVRVDSPNPDYDFRPIIPHEMLHIFLASGGFDNDRNVSHDHVFFQTCR